MKNLKPPVRMSLFFLFLFLVFTALDYFRDGSLQLVGNAIQAGLTTVIYLIAVWLGRRNASK